MIRRGVSYTGRMKAVISLLAILVLVGSAAAVGDPSDSVDTFEITWSGYRKQAHVVRDATGAVTYALTRDDGTTETLAPPEFASRVASAQRAAPFSNPISRLLNARSSGELLWILFGLSGQTLFAGRMIVQWIVSERHKRSVVPPIFWWLSVFGSAMLFTYFLWRADIVGILGQGMPLLIYVRNLMLIYGRHAPPPEAAAA